MLPHEWSILTERVEARAAEIQQERDVPRPGAWMQAVLEEGERVLAEPRTFPRDHHLRRQLFVEDSFQHKARCNLFWLAWLLDAYTKQGERVLDPMGGPGSILLAATKQRPVLTGDIERHWCRIQARNAVRIRTETMFAAPAQVFRWDAARLPLMSDSVPAIVTSPPYFDLFSDWNRKSGSAIDGPHVGPTGLCYGFHDAQLGNRHIYEDYLLAMRSVYRECWRVLGPGGILVLIVGDRVKRARVVPVTMDAETLCLANGFSLVGRTLRQTYPSQFRRIHAQRAEKNGEAYPCVDVETALVFEKARPRPVRGMCFAIIEAPSAGSSPGTQLFEKQVAYARRWADQVFVLLKDRITALQFLEGQKAVWNGDHETKARDRKEWCWGIARDLVAKWSLGAGDQLQLHVTKRYAPYLQQRLETLGAAVEIVAGHCNLGQKLAWYTELEEGRSV